jgi:uncharacterized protein YkwD
MKLVDFFLASVRFMIGQPNSLNFGDLDTEIAPAAPVVPSQPPPVEILATIPSNIPEETNTPVFTVTSAVEIPQAPEPPPVREQYLDASSNALSGGRPIIRSINDYRSRANLPPLVWDEQLVSNAARTGQATNGKAMVHQMNPGTNGQVLVYGFDDRDACGSNDVAPYTPFELFYMSWLCEVPGDQALGGQCDTVLRKSRIDSQGQTGHWQILSDPQYRKVGCAFTRDQDTTKCDAFTGIWACDVGL